MNARVPPVPSRTNASTISTGIFISTSLTVVPDTVQVNRSVDEPEMNAQMPPVDINSIFAKAIRGV
jgi:hypothetical protein